MDAPVGPAAAGDEEHVAGIRETAETLAGKLNAAADAGVSPAKILPVLMEVFRASGLMGAPGIPTL